MVVITLDKIVFSLLLAYCLVVVFTNRVGTMHHCSYHYCLQLQLSFGLQNSTCSQKTFLLFADCFKK